MGVVEVARDRAPLHRRQPRHLGLLRGDVVRVGRLDLDLLGDGGRDLPPARAARRRVAPRVEEGGQCRVVEGRAAQQVERRGRADERGDPRRGERPLGRGAVGQPGGGERGEDGVAARLLRPGPLVASARDQAEVVGERRQAEVGVVAAQQQAVLRARGQHPVGLDELLGDEVVDHHAEVALVAPQDDRVAPGRPSRGVDAGEEALPGGLLVAAGAVDLAGAEEAAHALRLQRRGQFADIDRVVLDRVAEAGDDDIAQGRDRAQDRQLHVVRQAGVGPLDVDLGRAPALRLEEELVGRLPGEADDLVLD